MISTILIIGAGAMGCLFAARLAGAGYAVTLVDVDNDRLAAIEGSGLVLRDDNGESQVFPRATSAADVSGAVDLILLFTKGVHSRAAVASIAHLAVHSPRILTLQNGVGNGEIIAGTFAADRVLVGTAHVPAELEPPNTVISRGFGHLHLGGFNPHAHSHACEVADVLRRAGFVTNVSEDVRVTIWEKLAFNAALNPLALIAGASNGMMNNDHGRAIAHRIVAETVAVAAAKGITLDDAQILATVDQALSEHGHHKASMLQDREAGRPTEIEFINGAIVREGLRFGVETTANEMLASIVRLIEAAAYEARR
jgi:2-dehydropantoate 2-reductase